MQNNSSIVVDLELAPRGAKEHVPQVGVDLFDADADVPWVREEEELPVISAEVADVPAPAPTPAAAPAMLEKLRAKSAETDPFEEFLKHNKVSANGLAAGAEPTIQEMSPLGALIPTGSMRAPKQAAAPKQDAWWLEPSAPPQYVIAPAVEAAPRKSRKMAAKLTIGFALLSAMISVGAFALNRPHGSIEPVAPLPPEPARPTLVAAQPEKAPVAVAAPVGPSTAERAKLLERTRAASAKKWAKMSWPEVKVEAPKAEEAVAEEPAETPPAANDLKRPEF